MRTRLVGRIADHLAARDPGHPLRVAVDGITAAGKTTFAAELAAAVEARGRPAIHVSMDGFHHPRAHRHRQGRDSADGYYQDAYDFPTFARVVLDPLGPGGDRAYRDRILDLAADEPVDEPPRTAPPDAVLLVDGSFLQRDLRWDEVVFVDTPFEVAVALGSRRDVAVFGGVDAAAAAFAVRYHAASRRYLSEVDPARRATVVFENRDEPALTRIGGPAGASVPLFSYGTLRLPDVQLAHFGRRVDSRADMLPGHVADRVTVTDPAVVAVSGADKHPIVRHTGDPADSVAGTVLMVTTEELAAADTYEVDHYHRRQVTLASGGTAWG